MTTRIQLRGHCQHCGSEQAVTRGYVAKHGYRVTNGYFHGVCSGHTARPIEADREASDAIIHKVRQDVGYLRSLASRLRAGHSRPKAVEVGRSIKSERVPFDDAPPWAQKRQVERDAHVAEQRARAGEQFANDLEALVIKCNGRPLREVLINTDGPARIEVGERRISAKGDTLTVTSVIGPRVFWKNGRGFKSWTGTQGWRRLPLATGDEHAAPATA